MTDINTRMAVAAIAGFAGGLTGLIVGYSLKSYNPEVVVREVRVPVKVEVVKKPQHKFTHVRTRPTGEEVYRYEVWHDSQTLEDVANAFNESDLSSGDKYDNISGASVLTADGKPMKEVSMKGFGYVVAKKKSKQVKIPRPVEPRVREAPIIINPSDLKEVERQPTKGTFALLINGDPNEERHIRNLKRAYDTLKSKGIDPCNIYIITDKAGFNGECNANRIFPAMLSKFRHVSADLEEAVKKDDRLVIYVTGHAGEGFVPLNPDEHLDYKELTRLAAKINPSLTIAISDGCFGGSLVNAFKSFNGKGIFYSPTKADEGVVCNWVSPHFWNGMSNGKADLNKDGITTLREAALLADGIYVAAMWEDRELTNEELKFFDTRRRGRMDPQKLDFDQGVFYTTGGIEDATIDGKIIDRQRQVPVSNRSLVDLNPNNYKGEVIDSPVPVIVDVYATWCYPCKRLAEEIEETRPEYAGRVKFTRIDYESDGARGVVAKYGNPSFRGYPTLLFFNGGRLIDTNSGYKRADELEELIERNFKVSK